MEQGYQQIDTDYKIVRKEKEILESQIQSMDEDMKRLSEAKKITTMSLQELSEAMRSIEEETKDQMSDLRIEIYEERKLAEEYKEQISKLTEDLRVAQGSESGTIPPAADKGIEELQKIIENLKAAEKELKNKVASKDNLINTLQEEIRALNTGSAPQGIGELRDRIFQLEQDLSSANDQSREATRLNKTYVQKIKELKKEIETTNAKL